MNDILIVDDEKDIRVLIADILRDEGYSTRTAGTSDACMAEIEAAPPGLIILDIWLKDSTMDGIDILKSVKRDRPEIPVVIISGHGNIDIAVAAIKQGAYDFIQKPFNIDQLLVVMRRAMETSKLRRENTQLKRQESGVGDMIGSAPSFKALKSNLDKVTRSNGRVMLTGPAGSGKELAARYIHSQSDRAAAPFVSFSSGAIAAEQLDEVLFGRERADHSIEPGLLEQANGGFLYFDEIADMPLRTQSKILRVLIDPKFQRVGGETIVDVDLRIISSTTRDLQAEIEAGRFRQELFYRLNVVPIAVPGLSDRREDIPDLAMHFIDMLNETEGLPRRNLSQDAQALLQTMDWPGNVRQLKNIVERVLILGSGDGEIKADELPDPNTQRPDIGAALVTGALAALPLREARELFEREYLMTQINRFGGNISRTANFVGMERSALHRKLKSLGVVTNVKSGARVAQIAEEDSSD